MGAAGALILALMKRKLSLALLREAMDKSAKLSTFVMFILIGSTIFGLVFRAVDGDIWVEHLLTSLPGGTVGFLFAVNLLFFLLGFFLDFFEIAFILVPLVAPVAEKMGIDLVWFGVMLSMNLQTSFLTPPFGFALFYLRSVAANKEYTDSVTGRRIAPITTAQIYRGSIAFIILQAIMVLMVAFWPELVLNNIQGAAKFDPSTIQIDVPQMDYGDPPPVEFK